MLGVVSIYLFSITLWIHTDVWQGLGYKNQPLDITKIHLLILICKLDNLVFTTIQLMFTGDA